MEDNEFEVIIGDSSSAAVANSNQNGIRPAADALRTYQDQDE